SRRSRASPVLTPPCPTRRSSDPLAEPEHDLREPVVILRLDGELAPPLRLEQILIGRGQAFLLHQISVERLDKGVEIDRRPFAMRSEEHTSELQSLRHLVCRLLLE